MPYKRRAFSAKKDALKSIWSGGSKSDMTKLERGVRKKLFRFFITLIIFFSLLATASWAGLYLTKGKYQDGGVKIDIQTPTEVNNFDEADVTIQYANHENFPLATAVLNLYYSPEFQPLSADPKADNDNFTQWTLGTVDRGKQNSITIHGKMLGRIGSKINFQATLTYKPANFNSEFQSVQTAEIFIKDSPLDLTFADLNKNEGVPGEPIELNFTYKNNGDKNISNLNVNLNLPSSFIIQSTDPTFNSDRKLFIKDLPPNDERKIKVIGAFPSEAEGDYEFAPTLSTDVGDKTYVLKEAKQVIKVLGSDLTLQLSVNELSEDQQAKLGDELSVRLGLGNQSENQLKNVTLKLTASSPLLDWSSFSGENKGTVKDNVMTWDIKTLPSLGELKKGDKINVNFKIKIVSSAGAQAGAILTLAGQTLVGEINGHLTQSTVQSRGVNIKIGSNLSLQSAARYFDDNHNPVGSGPLPPEVGKETKYRLIWHLANSFHALQNVKVSAPLPDNVRFEGKKITDTGTLTFDPKNRTVTWTIGNYPLNTKNMQAQFDVIAVPAASDKGKILLLLGESVAEGQDTTLQSQVGARAGALNSNLDDDKFAVGKGTVK